MCFFFVYAGDYTHAKAEVPKWVLYRAGLMSVNSVSRNE